MANDDQPANPFDQFFQSEPAAQTPQTKTETNPFDKFFSDQPTKDGHPAYEQLRAGLVDELRKDPGLIGQLFSLTKREVGTQGPEAQQAFIETVFNRSGIRRKPIGTTITDPGYYAKKSLVPANLSDEDIASFGESLKKVIQGSNISNNATGNASDTVGFNGGPLTARFGGEKFGIEGPDFGKTPVPYNPFDTILSEGEQYKVKPTARELATLAAPEGSPEAAALASALPVPDYLRESQTEPRKPTAPRPAPSLEIPELPVVSIPRLENQVEIPQQPPQPTPTPVIPKTEIPDIGTRSLEEAFQTGGLVGAGSYISNMAELPMTRELATAALRMVPAFKQLHEIATVYPHTPPGQISRGIEQGLVDQAAMLSSPTNLALIAGGGALPGAAGKVVTGWFLGQMARNLPDEWQDFVQSDNLSDRTRKLIGMAIQTGIIAGGGYGLVRGGGVSKVQPRKAETQAAQEPIISGQPSVHVLAKNLADELGGEVVGSAAKLKSRPNDIDIRLTELQIPDAIEKLKQQGFEQLDSSVVSPEEAKKSGKIFGEGWARSWNLKNPETGQKVQLWHQDEGILVPEAVAPTTVASAVEGARPALEGTRINLAGPQIKIGLMPQPSPFVTEDVIPTIKGAVTGMARVAHDVRAVLSPSTVSPLSRVAGGIVREHVAQKVRSHEMARTALSEISKVFDRSSEATNLAAIDALESGKAAPKGLAGAKWDAYKALREKAYDERIQIIRGLNPNALQNLVEDYFPHIWTQESVDRLRGNPSAIDPANPWSIALGKRPLAGRASFLQQRSIPDTASGLALGLEPVTTNPAELDLLKLGEMDRYIMGQRIMKEFKDAGLAKFIPAGAKGPLGYVQINDKIARVFAPKNWTIVNEAGETMPGQKLLGHYWAPEDAGRVINNYLSPGLRGFAPYEALRYSGNIMNQVQLGLSLYHAMFTAIDTAASSGALGIEQIARSGGSPREIARGGFNIAKSLTMAPIGGEFVSKLWKGNKFLREYSRPGTTNAELGKIVDAAIAGGVRPRMDTFYKTGAVDSFFKALKKGNYAGALLRVPMATVEAAAKPLMEHAVPRLKLGVISQMLEYELQKLPPNATRQQVRTVAQRVVDSVDNRMGQMIYDNLFWNKTLKDSLMASVRSVGWNLGDIRELGGGVLDTITAPKRALRSIRGRTQVADNPVVTHRMAYLAFYPIIVGALGAMYQYLKTGEPPRDTRDLFMPRTGQLRHDGSEERVMLPTYMKDIAPLAYAAGRRGMFGFTSRLGQMALNKLHPIFNMLGQMWQNKDYYGTEIRNEDDTAVQTLLKEAKFIGKQFQPFSFRGVQRRTGGTGEKLEAVGGIMPAPKEMTMTAAEEVAQHIWVGKFAQAPRTPEQTEATKQRADLAVRVRQGDRAALWEAQRNGTITSIQRQAIEKRVKMTPLQYQLSTFTPQEAMRVWNTASPAERDSLRVLIRKKVLNSKTLNREDRMSYLNILRE